MNNPYYLVLIGMGVTFLLAASLIIFYSKYQKRLMREQRKLQEARLAHQVELLHATLQSQEDERKRIGRDLHDGVGGMLSNIKMNINRMNASNNSNPLNEQCSMLINKTIADVRSISHSLSPPALELFGLAAALEELADDISKNGLDITVTNNAGGKIKRLDANAALMLYRVLQEMIANTLKHADATSAGISMSEKNDTLEIEYSDNGKGFDMNVTDQMGMGMRNIESRTEMIGAAYKIESSPGNGFKAIIKLN